MRTLHVGLRVAEPERSIAFYVSLGYQVLGAVPGTELGTLTMLKLPGDEFVALELVHDGTANQIQRGGFSHLVVQVEDVHATAEGPGDRPRPDVSGPIPYRSRNGLDVLDGRCFAENPFVGSWEAP